MKSQQKAKQCTQIQSTKSETLFKPTRFLTTSQAFGRTPHVHDKKNTNHRRNRSTPNPTTKPAGNIKSNRRSSQETKLEGLSGEEI
jgi:hypothetical protein